MCQNQQTTMKTSSLLQKAGRHIAEGSKRVAEWREATSAVPDDLQEGLASRIAYQIIENLQRIADSLAPAGVISGDPDAKPAPLASFQWTIATIENPSNEAPFVRVRMKIEEYFLVLQVIEMVNRELAELWTSVNHSSPQERRADIERVIAEIERSVRIESNGVLRLHGVEEQLRLAICAGGSSPSEDVPSISPR